MTTPRRLDRLVIDFAAGEGALQRILGLVERRGFDLRSVTMSETGKAGARVAIAVSPREPGRRLDTLQRQIERLHGIAMVAEDQQAAGESAGMSDGPAGKQPSSDIREQAA